MKVTYPDDYEGPHVESSTDWKSPVRPTPTNDDLLLDLSDVLARIELFGENAEERAKADEIKTELSRRVDASC